MQYRRLGQWGVKVSAVSLGTWLTYGGSTAETTAIECITRAYDHGVNLFDTANEYQQGRAETVLGKALRGLPRDSYLVATKVFMPVGDGPLDAGLSRKHIMGQVDHSLRRLGVDHLDLYQCHRFDEETPLEETAYAMDDLVRRGKILYWGVSEWSAEQLEHVVTLCRAHGWAVPVSDQPQYSLLWRAVEPQVLSTCHRLGMGLLAWSPLAMGILTGKYGPGAEPPRATRRASDDGWFLDRYLVPGVLEAVQRFRFLAEDTGYTAAQLALAWCLSRPSVTSVIVGASRVEQLDENIGAAELSVDPDVLRRAEETLAEVAERLRP